MFGKEVDSARSWERPEVRIMERGEEGEEEEPKKVTECIWFRRGGYVAQRSLRVEVFHDFGECTG